MKLTAPLIVIGVVIVAGVIYAVVTRKQTKDATVHFAIVAGACKATLTPDPLVVSKKNQKVKFTVLDDCNITNGYTLDTELVNWKSISGVKCDDATEFPLDGPAKEKKTFTRGIKDQCQAGMKFSFDIAVDGKVIADPELEIAP